MEKRMTHSKFTNLLLVFHNRSSTQLSLDLPDKGGRDPLLVLISRRVQVQDLDDLRDLQAVAHVADGGHVVVGFASLKQLCCLNDWLKCVDDMRFLVLDLLISSPLLELSDIVAERRKKKK